MAKVKILTREELCELKKKKAQKRAKSWLVDSHGVCSHIPTDKALVPLKKQIETSVKDEKSENNEEEDGKYGLFAMFLPFIILCIIAGIID